jgi:hypothetical protein
MKAFLVAAVRLINGGALNMGACPGVIFGNFIIETVHLIIQIRQDISPGWTALVESFCLMAV